MNPAAKPDTECACCPGNRDTDCCECCYVRQNQVCYSICLPVSTTRDMTVTGPA